VDIRKLRHFIAAAEERSINAAARRLNITQPPLTRQIQALEEELGVPLFTRANWGIELTPAGRELLSYARDISAHVDMVTEKIKRIGAGMEGHLELGVYGSAMLDFVPEVLRRFAQSHPDVRVSLSVGRKDRQIDALRQGRILVAIDRYFPDTPGLRFEAIATESVMVAVNEANPLAEKDGITVADLRGEALVGEQGTSILSAVAATFLSHDFQPRIEHRAPDMITAAIFVSYGLGCALVPESLKRFQLPNVVYRPLLVEPAQKTISLHCAYRADEDSPLLHEFLRVARHVRASDPA
jgi:DNA-binding transcriptional LysR family regulator